MQQSIFYMLSIATMMATSIRCTLHCKKQWREWLIATKECKIAPCNNQPNLCVALQGSKQRLQRHKAPAMKYIAMPTASLIWDDHFLMLYCKKQWWQWYCFCCIVGNDDSGWSRRASKIAPVTTNLFDQCGSTTLTIAKAWSARDNKIAMPQHNVDDATSILYCHIARSSNNNRRMWGKKGKTPIQWSNFHVVVCRMRWQPYHATQRSAAQVRQGWVRWLHQRWRASMPKRACTSPRGSMASTPRRPHSSKKAMMSPLSQRQLATYFVQGNNQPLATRAIGSVSPH